MSTFPINNESILTLQTFQEELFELHDNKDRIDARIKELNGNYCSGNNSGGRSKGSESIMNNIFTVLISLVIIV